MAEALPCNKGCGQQIWFDWKREYDDLGWKEGSSKANIPLQVSEDGKFLGKRHDCPKSTYNKGGSSNSANIQALEAKVDEVTKNVEGAIERIDRLIKHLMGESP